VRPPNEDIGRMGVTGLQQNRGEMKTRRCSTSNWRAVISTTARCRCSRP
jgi:hypothetical protein